MGVDYLQHRIKIGLHSNFDNRVIGSKLPKSPHDPFFKEDCGVPMKIVLLLLYIYFIIFFLKLVSITSAPHFNDEFSHLKLPEELHAENNITPLINCITLMILRYVIKIDKVKTSKLISSICISSFMLGIYGFTRELLASNTHLCVYT